jgi:acyl-CoA thioesterase-1
MPSVARARVVLGVLVLLAASACSFGNVQCGLPSEQAGAPAPAAPADPAAPGGASGRRTVTPEIVFLGDSLTAGYGLLQDQSYPAIVERRFADEGYVVETVNAGVSGDTSAGGRRRVEALLGPDTRVLVLALGGNDALRGLTVAETHQNLAAIISIALERNVSVLLCGMEAPTNLGEDYRGAFREIFLELIRDFRGRVALMPFLLEGVAGNPSLNQADGIHPNAAGAKIIADRMYPRLRTFIDQAGG